MFDHYEIGWIRALQSISSASVVFNSRPETEIYSQLFFFFNIKWNRGIFIFYERTDSQYDFQENA